MRKREREGGGMMRDKNNMSLYIQYVEADIILSYYAISTGLYEN